MDPRTPVLVGVGTADGSAPAEASDLMIAAAEAAALDAGAPGLLAAVQSVAVPRGSWSYSDPGRLVGRAIGAPKALTALCELGIPQQTPVSVALQRIAAGDLDVALVVGGEAKRRAAAALRNGESAPETDQAGAVPDELRRPESDIVGEAEARAGIWVPVQQYAMIDNALRQAESLSIPEHLDQIAELWSRFNDVATRNPRAVFPARRPVRSLRQPGPDNRPLSFPYAKWHCTQWTVDQAAALLLCSVSTARAHGISPERCIYPYVALESSHSVPLSRRAEIHRWPAMAVLGKAARDHLERDLDSLQHIELYSCFPAAVRVQQRELRLPERSTPTITGGMAFAGGPLNNFTYQATVAMVERLREEPGSVGLLTTVSGLLTKPGLAVWSTEAPDRPVLVADLAADAAAATATVEVIADYHGPARVATYTVTYAGLKPQTLVVIADTPDHRRCVAVSTDTQLAEQATRVELIAALIEVTGSSFELAPEQARRD
jgi:acetyl-CoA C-acetyltransferase